MSKASPSILRQAHEVGLDVPLETRILQTHKMADRKWRLNNLYMMLNEQLQPVRFEMRPLQEDFYDSWWWRNVILKSRQVGMCLDENTVVLTADLRWVPIKDMRAGDEVVGVDEYPTEGCGRKMRTATVRGTRSFIAEDRVRLTFSDGRTVICTPNHPWLSLSSATAKVPAWRSVDNTRDVSSGYLAPGSMIRSACRPWDADVDFEDGWFAGMLDGEGHLRESGVLNLPQVYGPVWDRMVRYVERRGLQPCVYDKPATEGTKAAGQMEFTRCADVMAMLGRLRPSRMVGRRFWDGKQIAGKGDAYAEIVSVEHIGPGPVVDLHTSTGTYIAEGLVSHNTTLIELAGLDSAIFIPNYRVVVISHKKDSAADILESKALYPYMNMHPELRSRVKLVEQNKTTLRFSNGSSIEVTNSGRSGTGNFLHISEFGYIAARRPDVAREIISGTLPGFHQGAMVFVESTAEGSDGQFREMCDTAQNLQRMGKPLTEFDFKFHFYSCFDRPENSLPLNEAEMVDIPLRLQSHFDELREKEGIVTDLGQQAWYTVQERTLQQDMKKEQPATPREAFESSGKGKILDLQMEQLRSDGRLTVVPVIAGRPVYSFWDIGLADDTACIFMQNVGHSWHIVDYLEGTDDGMLEWIRRVREYATDRRWNLADWVGPHDLKKRSASSGEPLWNELANAGVQFKVVKRVAFKKVSIDRLRSHMGQLHIDEEKCEKLVKHLDAYRWDYDDIRAVYKDKPFHGPESNGCDALQQWAMWVSDQQHQNDLLAMGRPERPRGQVQSPGDARPVAHRSMKGYC